jgi:hypothetical protein
MYPVAFGFIDGETTDNWTWFMTQLHKAIGDLPVLAISSYACKDLENAKGGASQDTATEPAAPNASNEQEMVAPAPNASNQQEMAAPAPNVISSPIRLTRDHIIQNSPIRLTRGYATY